MEKDEEIKPTTYRLIEEKEYKAHLKEIEIDNDKINEIWARIERGRK